MLPIPIKLSIGQVLPVLLIVGLVTVIVVYSLDANADTNKKLQKATRTAVVVVLVAFAAIYLLYGLYLIKLSSDLKLY